MRNYFEKFGEVEEVIQNEFNFHYNKLFIISDCAKRSKTLCICDDGKAKGGERGLPVIFKYISNKIFLYKIYNSDPNPIIDGREAIVRLGSKPQNTEHSLPAAAESTSKVKEAEDTIKKINFEDKVKDEEKDQGNQKIY